MKRLVMTKLRRTDRSPTGASESSGELGDRDRSGDQVAVILARFPDHTTQETKIPRMEIAAITEFLKQASMRFEGSADMRQ